jgi:hypothetical protein
MSAVFQPDRVTDAAKDFLRIAASEALTLRLIVAPFVPGSATPSTDYEEASDPFYSPQVIPYTDWALSTVNLAVRAVGPTCVFAFQNGATIYGFWLHRPDSPDDWVIQLLYGDGGHAITDAGGAEVVTPALQWFTGVQVAS